MRELAMTAAHMREGTRHGLNADALRGARVIEYAPGEWVCAEGQPLSRLLIVTAGRAKVCLFGENGRGLLLSFYEAGGMIGDLELMMGERRAQTSVQAVSAFTCVSVPLEGNRGVLLRDAAFLREAGAALARKLTRSSRNAAYNILYPLESRLCSYIEGVSRDDVFQEKLTETAELLGASYRHLLRALSALCKGGILEKRPNGYWIKDRTGLRMRGRGFYSSTER